MSKYDFLSMIDPFIYGNAKQPGFGSFQIDKYQRAVDALNQPKQAGPKVTTEYVIKVVQTDIAARKGGYILVSSTDRFVGPRTLEEATRFPTPLQAAKAIDTRNMAKGNNTSERYAIIPVTVTVTPASTTPGTKGFVLRISSGVSEGRYITFGGDTPTTGGSASYADQPSEAHVFATAAQAGEWIGRRLSSIYSDFSGPLTIVPYTAPATTVAASTTVTLA